MNETALPMEPTVGRFSNPVALYIAATRPAFLLATLVACLLGIAAAHYTGVGLHAWHAVMTIVLALLVHAAVNVLNDYYDALNGTDAQNMDRLFPFTGGSRFIQNGVLTTIQTARFGYGLLAAAILGGLWLVLQVGSGLLALGMIGLFIGWAYSAQPFSLNGRGLGELCVLTGFLGLVVGADFVQRQTFSWQPVVAGLPYALLATNLLYINQFPDRRADAAAGKRHWVVRLAPRHAAYGYPMIAGLALIELLCAVYAGHLPKMALWSALPIGLSMVATKVLIRYAAVPKKLLPAIKMTLAAMLGHGILLAVILLLEAT
jgi:1,4-dihydroxy-2-naphthoate octaprenyltransferase